MTDLVQCCRCEYFDYDVFEIDFEESEIVECLKGHSDRVGFDPVECEDFKE